MTMVDLFPDPDQQQIVDSTRQVLRRDFPLTAMGRPGAARILAEKSWEAAAGLGWLACGLPGEMGGAGFTEAEDALLFRELGGALVSPAVMASLLAGLLTMDSAPVLAHAFANGDRRVGLLIPESMEAADRLEGAVLVLGHGKADDVLHIAPGKGPMLLPAGMIRDLQAGECIDPTLQLERGILADISSAADVHHGSPGLGRLAHLLIAAQLVGIAEATRDLALEHAKLREQFGQPIGAFQAVAHHCVDMELRARASLSQLTFAAIACRDGRDDEAFQTQSALLVAADAAFRNATVGIRILGGMGYSEESGAHLFLKRAMVLRALVGGEQSTRAALLEEPLPF